MTFEASHSYERMKDPQVLASPGEDLPGGRPGAQDGEGQARRDRGDHDPGRRKAREHVELVRGRPGNPMSDEEIEQKCTDLMRPVLGEERTACLIERIWNLEKVGDMRELRPLLSPEPVTGCSRSGVSSAG